MKKPYQKPGMYIENFSVSQSVAAGGCGAKPNSTLGKPGYADKSSCGWDMGNFITWVEGTGSTCNDFEDADTEVEGLCYNNPEGGISIFSYS